VNIVVTVIIVVVVIIIIIIVVAHIAVLIHGVVVDKDRIGRRVGRVARRLQAQHHLFDTERPRRTRRRFDGSQDSDEHLV
jgi:sensor domain CHASE-containing protein